LTRFLFRPVINTLDERLEKIEGLNKKGKEIEEEVKKKTAGYEDKLKEVRHRALEMREGLKKDGLEEEKKTINAAAKEAKDIIEEKKGGIYKDIERVKSELGKRIEENSRDIAEKVLGRRIE
jgi:F-type H+-transporting ATPase subunit b